MVDANQYEEKIGSWNEYTNDMKELHYKKDNNGNSIFNNDEINMIDLLYSIGQSHLFKNWKINDDNDDNRKKLLEQCIELDKHYEGGLKQYVKNSMLLLKRAKDGVNPFEGWKPEIPHGKKLKTNGELFNNMEKLGLNNIKDLSFILVAGGLGERLGFGDIKIKLPTQIIDETSYFQQYAKVILAYEAYAKELMYKDKINSKDIKKKNNDNDSKDIKKKNNDSDSKEHKDGKNLQQFEHSIKNFTLPLAIMTSGSTHDKTVEYLTENNYFGLKESQVTLMKQEKVVALQNYKAEFAVDANDPYKLVTKPHGHGDVHSLVYKYEIAKKWLGQGKKWVLFFQDTNILMFNSLLAVLGVSVTDDLDVNTFTVPRRPGEAVGSICRLVKGKENMTINVEYNQLNPLLKATSSPEGDVPDESGFSPYPGNTNSLLFKLDTYVNILDVTKGRIAEFVNPKYKDETCTEFASPVRLECMMQDYPKALSSNHKVGFTELDRYMAFSVVKAHVVSGLKTLQKSGFSYTAAGGESEFFWANRKKLSLVTSECKMNIDGKDSKYLDIPVQEGARILYSPEFALTLSELKDKFKNAKIDISDNSVLIIEGKNISFKNADIKIDGTVVIKAGKDTQIDVEVLQVKNKGWTYKALTQEELKDKKIKERYHIRGYTVEKLAEKVFNYPNKGKVKINCSF